MGMPSPNAVTTRAMKDAEIISRSGAWAKEARQSASERAQSQGLPKRRDEYWKYTRPAVFVAGSVVVSFTHLRAHETRHDFVCRLLLDKKNFIF